MDVTTQRRCLGAIAGGLLIGTVGSVAWSLSAIEPPEVVARSLTDKQIPLAADAIQRRPPGDRVTGQSLRGPLYDPPPAPRARPPAPAPAPTPPSQPKLDVTLTVWL